MSIAILHYVYDPFCGWCYGAAPMITEATAVPGLEIQAHGVGMLSGEKSKFVSPEWRDFVRPHEARITAYSKQNFADAYVQGVLEHEDVRLDSSPPIAAMLTAQQLSGRGIEMLKRLQTAYYQEGRAIADHAVILEIARELGFESEAFILTFDAVTKSSLQAHIERSNEMLEALHARGFPAFALEIDGQLEALPVGHYLNRPALLKADIESRLNASSMPAVV
ncbi:DsbA family protein [Pseudomonas sp. PCH199]|uniref:DsbA family protein n=1 Tax=unclassified Pseudomonas TaxID=196821 RepID=UPI000BDDD58F|nr:MULTISPECIES: DsbA family protein [unclassified Pseudomonas]MCW8277254.1 DsbA family protein [Pseudomonas sp. PCH199]PAM82469.1 protein-disulfide isomerase [Pseudomonas sp. ERMR1:02]